MSLKGTAYAVVQNILDKSQFLGAIITIHLKKGINNIDCFFIGGWGKGGGKGGSDLGFG